jgi:hypothetical protein
VDRLDVWRYVEAARDEHDHRTVAQEGHERLVALVDLGVRAEPGDVGGVVERIPSVGFPLRHGVQEEKHVEKVLRSFDVGMTHAFFEHGPLVFGVRVHVGADAGNIVLYGDVVVEAREVRVAELEHHCAVVNERECYYRFRGHLTRALVANDCPEPGLHLGAQSLPELDFGAAPRKIHVRGGGPHLVFDTRVQFGPCLLVLLESFFVVCFYCHLKTYCGPSSETIQSPE